MSGELLADPGRIRAIIASSREGDVINQVSARIAGLDPHLVAWTDVADDDDGRLQTARSYKDSEVYPLPHIFGAAAGVEAHLSVRGEIFSALEGKFAGKDLQELIQLFESREARLPDVDRLKVLEALSTRLIFLINSNPRVVTEAIKAAEIFRPIKEAIGGSYDGGNDEERPNGLPWVFSASGYGKAGSLEVDSAVALQGWRNNSPLADLNPKHLQVFGVIGTATEVYKTLYGEAKRIQFSSRFAPKATEEVLVNKLLDSIVWAVPDFEKRYNEDPEFRILADTVLRLVARESWIAYGDGFGNLIGQERYDFDGITETVLDAKDGEELNLVINGGVFKPVKCDSLADAHAGRLNIYLNGEDSRRNFNIVVPWPEVAGRAAEDIFRGLVAQGISEASCTAEIKRAELDAAIRGETFLRLNAHNLLCGTSAKDGFTLNSLEVRVLSGNSGQGELATALEQTKIVDRIVRNR